MKLILPRRKLLLAAAGLICAPAILRAQVPMTGAGKAKPGAAAGYSGPLDVVTGGATPLAWYGLRAASAAKAAATANCIDVYDTATGLIGPTTITVTTAGNLDVATIAGLGYGVSVSKLYDQVGTNHVVNATHANRPTITLSGLGALPIMSLSGSQYLISGSALNQNQPFVASAVAIRTGSFTSDQTWYASVGSATIAIGFRNAANTLLMFAGNVVTAAANDSTWHAVQMTMNGASGEIYTDGSGSTVNGGANNSDAATRYGGDATNNIVGAQNELGLWSGTFTAGDKTAINSNQHTYWGF